MNEFDYIILTNPHRESLAVPHFENKNPKIFLSEDWEYTPPSGPFVHGNELGAYRCYMSHIMGMKMIESDCGLIMEDDCIPNYDHDWESALTSGYDLIMNYNFDVACFYLNLDGQHPKNFYRRGSEAIQINNFSWYESQTKAWYVGAVCYMISKNAANRISDINYQDHRLPIDVLLWQTDIVKFAVIDPIPFIHDRSQGSVLENAR